MFAQSFQLFFNSDKKELCKLPENLNTKYFMLTKTKIKEVIENLPEEISIDEFFDKLILIEKAERGNRQSENKEVISEKELDNEIERWFK